MKNQDGVIKFLARWWWWWMWYDRRRKEKRVMLQRMHGHVVSTENIGTVHPNVHPVIIITNIKNPNEGGIIRRNITHHQFSTRSLTPA